MQKPTHGPIWRALNWVMVPLLYPEYRRLVTRSFVLSLRLELLCAAFSLISPFATPGLLLLMRQRFDNLRADVAEFGRLVRARRAAIPEQCTAATTAVAGAASPCGEFQNPWV
ncbi:MAG TPA: hypothetical protein VMB34_19350 [Acetobacteraceae bacterium]|nr:hypothetical protein [Acetobacteraceae bacterium]